MKILLTALAIALVTSAAHAQLFVVSNANTKVSSYDAVTGTVINANLITGLSNPLGIATFKGALYVANNAPSSTVKYAFNGAPITVPFIDSWGGKPSITDSDFFVTTFANTLGKFTTASGAAVNISFITGLNNPQDVLRSGNTLYIANFGSNSIGTYRADTGAVINASFITGLTGPLSLALFNNVLYVSNFTSNTVGTYNPTTGATINASLISGLSFPADIAVFGGFLYVANRNGATVGKYTPEGAVVTVPLVTGIDAAALTVAFDKSTAIDLGVISSTTTDYATPDRTTLVNVPAARQVVWYKFSIPENADAASTRFLDIATRPTSPSTLTGNDTEIGIYNSDGVLVANDDDNSTGDYSQLSFNPSVAARGPLTAPPLADAAPAAGAAGTLPAGTYYLAVSVFNTTFLASEFDVASAATNTGTFNLEFRTDIPTPVAPNRAPTLKITANSIRPTTKSIVTLRGTTADVNGGTPRVYVKVNRAKFLRARGGLKWTFPAKLKVGRNPVKIYAIDAGGLRSPIRRVTAIRRP